MTVDGLTTVAAEGALGSPPPPRSLGRLLRRHPRWGLGLTLGPTLTWMLVVYVGSLVALVVAAMFRLDPASQKPTTDLTTANIVDALLSTTALRLFGQTVAIAAAVTVLSVVLALPTAFFIAKVTPRWIRRGLMVSVMLPLWAGYMVKTYAWRTMVAPAGGNKFAAAGRGGGGFLQSVIGMTPGYTKAAVVIALTYLWLPYMVLPIYAGLERLPASLLDAAGDLGARPWRTFRTVVLPLLLPGIAAGSIFTFSLSLGDYILPRIVIDGKQRVMFGEFINATLGAPNQPLAAAYTILPLVMIILYLLAMRRAGAFESL